MGAEPECRLTHLAAVRTFVRRYFPGPGPKFVAQASTTPAFNKGNPFFHPEQGNKKDRNVMVSSLEICLKQAARRTPSGLVFKRNGFWLYSGYEKEHVISEAVLEQPPE